MTTYKIGELAQLTNHTAHTLRYYEKEGLLQNIKRDENGLRNYSEHDLEIVKSITCLKETGMSLKEIKKHIDLFHQGKQTYNERIELFQLQKQLIEAKMKELKQQLATAEYKIWYYQNMPTIGDEKDPLNCQKMKDYYEMHILSQNSPSH